MPAIPNCPNNLSKENMRAISAPYNFVPLSSYVHIPEWSKRASHDWPFEDGLSGEIHYTLVAESPLLVGGEQQKAAGESPAIVKPFKLPDGRYAIPGSSLKGMLRAVTEIAGFGRMRMVDDRQLSIRDLTPGARPFYGRLMTNPVGRMVFEPEARAGWLTFDARKSLWVIQPCEYARVEHDDLAIYSGDSWWKNVPREPEARVKYARWSRGSSSLIVDFDPDAVKDHVHSRGIRLRYRRALNLGSGKQKGVLVFTGQPAKRDPRRNGRKHMEFIFYNAKGARLDVPEEVWRGFSQIYGDNSDWNWWKAQSPIPVFYLLDGNVQSLGLSLMYRLAYRNTIHDAIRNSCQQHLERGGGYDLADLLFGSIDGENQDMALRGRVSVEAAIAQGDVTRDTQPPTILNAPKPSYYPNYIRQDTRNNGTVDHYQTLMDEGVCIRGFKRYIARSLDRVGVQRLQGNQNNANVQVQLCTLNTGTRFEGRIVYHNLKPEELGLLLWVLNWGNDHGLRHGLGMGKPFGFGQVRFEVDLGRSTVIPNCPHNKKNELSNRLGELLGKFTDYMESVMVSRGGWEQSPQIRNLLAMADPECAPAKNLLRHMCLDSNAGINEYIWAKNKKLALRDFAEMVGWPCACAKKRRRVMERGACNEEAQEEKENKKEVGEKTKALPEAERTFLELQSELAKLPERVNRENYGILTGLVNKYLDKARRWTMEEREEAANRIRVIYETYGAWAQPGQKSAKKKRQREKKEQQLKLLIMGNADE